MGMIFDSILYLKPSTSKLLTPTTMAFSPPIPPKPPWYASSLTVPGRKVSPSLLRPPRTTPPMSLISIKMNAPTMIIMMMLIASLDKTSDLYYHRTSHPPHPPPTTPPLVLLSPPRTNVPYDVPHQQEQNNPHTEDSK